LIWYKKWEQWYEKIKVYILKLIKSESISKNLYDLYATDILNINISKNLKINFK